MSVPRILIVKTWEVAIHIFFKVCPTNKKNGCQRKKDTRLVEDPKRTIKGIPVVN
jgi:hypothetical protein